MELLKEKRFWAALGLGLALCALVPLSIQSISPGHESLWERYLLPWLVRTLLGSIVLLVALITAIRLRPLRPERLAAVVGFMGGAVTLGIFFSGPTYFFAGNFSQGIIQLVQDLLQIFSRVQVPIIHSSLQVFLLPIAVICWLAANYWRVNNWAQFWRGPGGAIIRGGLVAGLIILPIYLASVWYQHTVLTPQYIKQLSKTGMQFTHQARHFSWGGHLIMGLNGIISGAVVTAILTSLRPKPALGAFAGSGLMLMIEGVAFILMKSSGQPPSQAFDLMFALLGLRHVLLGAIAGSFAGRWSEIEIAKTE